MSTFGKFGVGLVVAGMGLLPMTALAEIDGYGPDAWQVVDVAPDDVLNVRMGPGTAYPVTGSFAHNARGLQQETCVPLISFEQSMALSDAQRANLPPRWCLMHDSSRQTRGWVAARYLAEDGSTPVAVAPAGDDTQTGQAVTDPIPAAEAMVRELYSAHAMALRGSGMSPLQPPRAFDFFSDNLVMQIDPAQVGADPLYDAQDSDISGLRIAADPDRPVFRGMTTIHADFLNFGHPTRVSYFLRPDTERAGSPLLIFRIEYEEWEIW